MRENERKFESGGRYNRSEGVEPGKIYDENPTQKGELRETRECGVV